jgi:hypothetical protein
MSFAEGFAFSPLVLMAVVAGIFASMFYLVIIWTHITKHYNFYKWVALALPFVPAGIFYLNGGL